MHRVQFILPAVAIGLLIGAVDVHAGQYRHLCTSTRACAYSSTNVPFLNTNVCYSATSGVRLKGTAPCPSGSWPYYLDYGEVIDPVTNAVAAYIPLDNACSEAGRCVDGPPPDGAQEYPMCCTTDSQGYETCWNGGACGGTLWWCEDGVCNDDGTITCFEKEAL
jgi:hypothetical protein